MTTRVFNLTGHEVRVFYHAYPVAETHVHETWDDEDYVLLEPAAAQATVLYEKQGSVSPVFPIFPSTKKVESMTPLKKVGCCELDLGLPGVREAYVVSRDYANDYIARYPERDTSFLVPGRKVTSESGRGCYGFYLYQTPAAEIHSVIRAELEKGGQNGQINNPS